MSSYYGLLSGAAFTITYSVAGIFAGNLVDRVDRSKFLGIGCILWSLATFTTGVTTSFPLVIAMRMALGMLQSINNPASLTLLSDYFPKEMRGTVNGIQSSGIYVGGALSSLTVLIIGRFGWRAVFQGMGVVGAIIGAAILLFVKDPIYDKTANACCTADYTPEKKKRNIAAEFFGSLKDLMANPVTRYATIAGGFNFVGGYTCMYFMPAFY